MVYVTSLDKTWKAQMEKMVCPVLLCGYGCRIRQWKSGAAPVRAAAVWLFETCMALFFPDTGVGGNAALFS